MISLSDQVYKFSSPFIEIKLHIIYEDKNFDIDIQNGQTGQDLKEEIYKLTQLKQNNQFLITQNHNTPIEDNITIQKAGLNDNDYIEVYGTNEEFNMSELHEQTNTDDQALLQEVQPTGINNPSNLCYLNSAIQAINYITPFKKLFNTINFQDLILTYLKAVIQNLDKPETVNILQFHKAFISQFDQFSNIMQEHDSQEALYELEKLIIQYSRENIINIKTQNDFQGIFIPITFDKQIQSVNEGFDKFTQQNGQLKELPQYLQFHLQRFAYEAETQEIQKLTRKLNYEENIQVQGQEYKLKIIIAHKGMSATSGHFVCYVKINQNWWCLNDSQTQAVDQAEIKKLQGGIAEGFQAYVLIYEKP